MSERQNVLILMYDLPFDTPAQRKNYRRFFRDIKQMGFTEFQKSVYVKLIRNVSTVEREIQQLKNAAPKEGTVSIFPLSMKEFKSMRTVAGKTFDISLFADDIVWIEAGGPDDIRKKD